MSELEHDWFDDKSEGEIWDEIKDLSDAEIEAVAAALRYKGRVADAEAILSRLKRRRDREPGDNDDPGP